MYHYIAAPHKVITLLNVCNAEEKDPNQAGGLSPTTETSVAVAMEAPYLLTAPQA